MPEKYYTVSEIAEILRVSRQTVYNWIDRHELKARRFGGSVVRIALSDFDEFQKNAAITGYPSDNPTEENPKRVGSLSAVA